MLKPLDHLIDLEISATSHESPKLDIAINDYSMLVSASNWSASAPNCIRK
ncbi:hypothetical protein [Sphingobium sp. LB126]|nr:hypothetical protein [Sphingobium sp. LB126]